MKSSNYHILCRQRKLERARRRWKGIVRARHILKSLMRKRRVRDNISDNFTMRIGIVTEVFPQDCRFFDNLDSLIELIKRIIRRASSCEKPKIKIVKFDLSQVKLLDTATINVILALANYLGIIGITVKGNYPVDKSALQILINSDFFSIVESGRKVPIRKNKDDIYILSGNNKTNQDGISAAIHKIMNALGVSEKNYSPLYNTLGEIAGNSVEHANKVISAKNWFLSVHIEENRAMIMMADIGKGILSTLNLLLKQEIYRVVVKQLPHETLLKLFKGHYQSSTREENRNNGLPDMWQRVCDNYLRNIIVISNNAILDFSGKMTKTLNNPFPGTFYYIEIDKENIEKWYTRIK